MRPLKLLGRLLLAILIGGGIAAYVIALQPHLPPNSYPAAGLALACIVLAYAVLVLLERGVAAGVLRSRRELGAFFVVAMAASIWVLPPFPAKLNLPSPLQPWLFPLAHGITIAGLLVVLFGAVTWLLRGVFGEARRGVPLERTDNAAEQVAAARRPANRRALLIVLLVAAVIRLWSLASIHLLIWDDSPVYLGTAQELYQRHTGSLWQLSQIPYYMLHQMPGYAMVLAGVFHACGVSPLGILVFQHLVGLAGVALLAWLAIRLAGPVWGLLAGLLFALDPIYWVFESWVMTETLAVTVLLAAAAFALLVRRAGPLYALLLGMLCATCYLIRPNLQVCIAFLVAAWLLKVTPRWSARVALGLVVLVGFVGLTEPWREFQKRRGVGGAARTYDHVQWFWAACAELLDPDYPLSPELAQAFEPYRGRRFGKHQAWEYHLQIQSFANPRLWPELGRWARASILENPGGYARALVRALGWHLEIYRAGDPIAQSELREDFLKRAPIASYRPAEHIQFSPLFHDFHRTLYIQSAGGPLRSFVGWYAGHYPDGVPQVPLAALSLLALLLALLRRQWPVALVLLGAFALVGVNVITLTAPSRYSVPAWALFYLGAALVPALLVGRPRGLATAPAAHHGLPPLRRPAMPAQSAAAHSAGAAGPDPAAGAEALVAAGGAPAATRSNSAMA